MDEARRFFVPETLMRRKADLITDLCIGRHFRAAPIAGPILGMCDQRPPDARFPVFRLDVPSFEITNLIARTILNKGPDACFKKPQQAAVPRICNKDHLRVRVREDVEHFGFVIVVRSYIPQMPTHTEPLVEI